jgi:O-antigen/teichoic acid export membrane protein
VLLVCLGFATNIVVARTIGPSGRGIVSLLYLFPFFMGMIFAFGIDEANVYFLGGKRAPHADAFANIVLMTLAGSLLCCGITLLARNYILARVLKNIAPAYYMLAVLSIPFFLFNRLGTTIFQGHRDFVSFNIVNVFVRLSTFLVSLVLLVLLGMGLAGGALSVPIAAFCVSILLFFLLKRRGSPSSRPDLPLLGKSFSYGLRAQPGVLMSFFNQRLDVFIINYFLTPADVGLYVIGVSVAELLWNLPNAVGLTLFPQIASSDVEEGKHFTCKVSRNLLFLMLLVAALLALVGRPLILSFFGRQFLPSLVPFWILLPGVILLGMAKVMSSNFHGRGKPQYGTYITIVSVTLTVALDLLLIPRMGIVGAALASTIAYGTSGVLSVFWFMRQTKASLSEILFVRWREIQRLPALAVGSLRK